MRLLSPTLLACILALPAAAQDRPNTILVMDGSGSMWGQIDGVAKITIAQDVVSDLLNTLPGEQRIGLTAYGHRARGDCTDIETIVAPAENTRAAIAAAVSGIKPLGKTPMTDAVIAAAEALRYTEDSATVILVSDGVETCNPDPCAAARLLEESGIDFTAHVIGFDVGADAKARAQMQCIADETGGMFIPAANAGELAQALNTIVEEPEGVTAPEIAASATLDAQDTAPISATIPVGWDGPNGDGDYIGVSDPTADGYINYVYTNGANPANLLMPTQVGTYELRYYAQPGAKIIVTRMIEVLAVDVALDAAAQAEAGATIPVAWDGPDYPNDYIGIGPVGETSYINYTYTNAGNPAMLEMPTTPGDYEIRYHLRQGGTVIATRPIAVTNLTTGLVAADTAVAGSRVTVGWDGPDYPRDFIAVGEPGSSSYINYTYTSEGNPLTLEMPTQAGDYEIRYTLSQDNEVIETRPITVTRADSTIDAPETGDIGGEITVNWTGPDYPRDYISIGKPGEQSYANYTYTSEGSPLSLRMPSVPGDYEIRYQLHQDNTIIQRRAITVQSIKVQLLAPATIALGETLTVGWDGPDNAGDYIGISSATDATGYDVYSYTSDGNPAQLSLPDVAGDYEVRYFLDEDNTIIARVPLTITE